MHGCRWTIAAQCLIGLAALVAAPTAWAGTVVASRDGNVVTIATTTTEARDESVDMFLVSAGGDLRLDGQLGTDVDPGSGCFATAIGTDVTCGPGPTVARIVIRPGGGDDTFRTRAPTGGVEDVAAEIDADMGPGDDALIVSDNSQRVVARGGAGEDTLWSGPAADRLDGGAGPDFLGGELGDDELIGGPDLDLAFYTGHTGDLRLSLDGVRNDGDPALGESDLLVGIESLTGGGGNDVIVGDAGLNDLTGGGGADRIDGGGGFDRLAGDAGNDTLLARDGVSDTVDCGDDGDLAITDDIDIPFECEDRRSAPDLQPDRDGDGVDRPLDCNDLDGTVRPGAFDRPGDGVDQNCDGADAVDNDRDRDGFPVGLDCDDGNLAIHPGARETLGDAVDDDCDGRADPFPAFPTVALLSVRTGPVTEVVGLVLVDLDGRERVRITCKGRGCRARSRKARAGRRAESLILDRLVRGQRLRPGARLRVRITRADGVRKTVTFTMRAGKSPRQRTRCSAPGGGRVARC